MNAVLAAGAVVWRKAKKGGVEILLIHRPRYDDWSLPKGKVENAELQISCAYREVLEETGMDVVMGPFLGHSEYTVTEGLKRVSYWAAKIKDSSQTFVANSEADEARWVNFEEAECLATQSAEKDIIQRFAEAPYDANALILLRHAKAISRDEWQGGDEDRPLATTGVLQANRMLSVYQVFGIDEIFSSDAIRCYDTVNPMAKALGLNIKLKKSLSERIFEQDKSRALGKFKEIITEKSQVLVCSHNPILPRVLEKMLKKSKLHFEIEKLHPGEAWVVFHYKKEIAQVDRVPSPII
ncbi:MAG: hypothetical protein RL414_187 [Actinomycetota bacterium]|jgi:8-oxo-dGTP diphosphatase